MVGRDFLDGFLLNLRRSTVMPSPLGFPQSSLTTRFKSAGSLESSYRGVRGTLVGGFVLLMVLPASMGWADVVLPAIFSDHAVLQSAEKVPIWGKADPGEKVIVSLGDAKAEAQAGGDGRWQVALETKSSAEGPLDLIVEGKNKLVIRDVLVGEVWVCSGQSNMELAMPSTFGQVQQEISQSANPMLRQFLVEKNSSLEPIDTMRGKWAVCSPNSVVQFTAVGYYFGKMLQKELKRPVGLINTSWGSTPCESWTSSEGLDADPVLKARKNELLTEAQTFPQRLKEFAAAFRNWEIKYDRQSRLTPDIAEWASPAASITDWKPFKVPGLFAQAGLPDSGTVWLRKLVTVNVESASHDLELKLGLINGFDTVYWNGEKVGETSPDLPGSRNLRTYIIPGKLVKAGEGTLAIRISNPAGGAGIEAPKDAPPLMAGPIPLNGEWLAKEESRWPELSEEARKEYPQAPNSLPETRFIATTLYNAMISPIIPYAIRGVIWYQGEANASRALQYRTAFPLMIQDWRSHWGQGDFPFYFCQLANYAAKQDAPGESSWAELREAQSRALEQPSTGMAVLIDIGEEGDIHPRNKVDVGDRLAWIALAKNYGKQITFEGPKYRSISVEGEKIRVAFQSTGGGLTAKKLPEISIVRSRFGETRPLIKPLPDSELQGFAICGEDRKWKWAQAKIEGDTVLVWSAEVPKPKEVRYAWASNPTCNLANGAGLPASPFRTDDFPAATQNRKY